MNVKLNSGTCEIMTTPDLYCFTQGKILQACKWHQIMGLRFCSQTTWTDPYAHTARAYCPPADPIAGLEPAYVRVGCSFLNIPTARC